FIPFFRERLARQHHVDRARRIAMGKGAAAGERLLHHDAGRQGIFPFHIGAHDAGDVEGVLHEMHIGVARSRQLAMQRVRRAAGEQHHGQAVAEQILDRHAGVRGTGIDMYQHGLAPAGGKRIAAGHVHRDDLVRAQDHFGMLAAFLVPARDLLDDRDMVGAEIGENVVDPEIDKTLEEVVRSGVTGHYRFSATNLLRSVPMPVISISTTSPALMSGDAPSVPIQITSPGHSVKYLVSSTMNGTMPKIISLVWKRPVSLPLTLMMVSILSRLTSVSIHGPIGLKVSAFLARHRPRSAFCQLRSLTSLPMV